MTDTFHQWSLRSWCSTRVVKITLSLCWVCRSVGCSHLDRSWSWLSGMIFSTRPTRWSSFTCRRRTSSRRWQVWCCRSWSKVSTRARPSAKRTLLTCAALLRGFPRTTVLLAKGASMKKFLLDWPQLWILVRRQAMNGDWVQELKSFDMCHLCVLLWLSCHVVSMLCYECYVCYDNLWWFKLKMYQYSIWFMNDLII